ncbi:DUF4912 domain-containing protein [Hazenella sp. IB182357]|uniref:DUF4912 domain-containing protein n=1 Tax=Polycladospora coralii TaxID=2771432 RepID=A0A926N8N7_9BACL|nr:DUF4912 domain-containing protein [Polycladospora coralii]MBD1371708.1 DUF4912 domain-containing protein [Polycladospora coralii]MBS7529175.1 DUF4912 domain-containing protein [Polycladospora coralii]
MKTSIKQWAQSLKTSLPKKNVISQKGWQLPNHYNQNRIKVIAHAPTKLYAYWEMDEARHRLIKTYCKINETKPVYGVRLYYANQIDQEGLRDRVIPSWAQTCYFEHLVPGNAYQLDVGIYYDGRFSPILRSESVKTPDLFVISEKKSNQPYTAIHHL